MNDILDKIWKKCYNMVVSRPKKTKKFITIREKKLGRERADGSKVWAFCYKDDYLIEIDPRQRPKKYFNTLVHELLHLVFPDASETKVTRSADIIVRELWKAKYRKTIQ